MNKRKQEKQQEAIDRQLKYDKLSIKDKINLAKSRRGNSLKEITKLEKEKHENK